MRVRLSRNYLSFVYLMTEFHIPDSWLASGWLHPAVVPRELSQVSWRPCSARKVVTCHAQWLHHHTVVQSMSVSHGEPYYS